MISLASLLGALMAILQAHPICKKVTVIETKEFSPEQFFFKIRAKLVKGDMQVRIYYNQGGKRARGLEGKEARGLKG